MYMQTRYAVSKEMGLSHLHVTLIHYPCAIVKDVKIVALKAGGRIQQP